MNGTKYNDEEFLCHFRLDRQHFLTLLELIRDHPRINIQNAGYRHHGSVELHLLVTLKYFGAEGNGASMLKVKDGLGISKGSAMEYVERTVDAILSLEDQVLFWPGREERNQISKRIHAEYHFPCCVCFVDGTHLGLAFKPETRGEEYWTRKQSYAVHALLFCDDVCQIRHIVGSWLASVHDNRVWKTARCSWRGRISSVQKNTAWGVLHSTTVK